MKLGLRDLKPFHFSLNESREWPRFSEPFAGDFTEETRQLDLDAVLTEIDAKDATLLGISEGGWTAATYSFEHPERVSRLILYGSYCRGAKGRPDYDEEEDQALVLSTGVIGHYMPLDKIAQGVKLAAALGACGISCNLGYGNCDGNGACKLWTPVFRPGHRNRNPVRSGEPYYKSAGQAHDSRQNVHDQARDISLNCLGVSNHIRSPRNAGTVSITLTQQAPPFFNWIDGAAL